MQISLFLRLIERSCRNFGVERLDGRVVNRVVAIGLFHLHHAERAVGFAVTQLEFRHSAFHVLVGAGEHKGVIISRFGEFNFGTVLFGHSGDIARNAQQQSVFQITHLRVLLGVEVVFAAVLNHQQLLATD